MVMFGYAIWRFKAKPGDESDGEPIHGNTRLEIAWTVIPTIIVLFGAGYSWVVLDDIEEPAPTAERMQVNVTAQQFAWTFEYPEEGVTSDELHVPVGQQLDLSSRARRAPLVLGPGVADQARPGPAGAGGRRGRRHRLGHARRRAPTA